MNPLNFRGTVAMVAHDKGLDLDSPKNKYSVWAWDGLYVRFLGARPDLAEAMKHGRRFITRDDVFILVGRDGEILPLEALDHVAGSHPAVRRGGEV